MAIAKHGEFQDPRPLINRLRRVDLWKICDLYKIEYNNSTEQPESLIRKILEKGIDVRQYVVYDNFGFPHVNLNVRQMPFTEKEVLDSDKEKIETDTVKIVVDKAVEKPEAVKKVHKSYEEMTVFELRSICKKRNIPWTYTEKKISLLAKITSQAVQLG